MNTTSALATVSLNEKYAYYREARRREHAVLVEAVEALLRSPLTDPEAKGAWSAQGFGMLRLYISPETRLHVWSSALRAPHVSDLHDHPWDFVSEIVCGQLTNERFGIDRDARVLSNSDTLAMEGTIVCGPQPNKKGPIGEPARVALWSKGPEVFVPGDFYRQEASEVHRTSYLDGTVTICQRVFKEDTEHARVYWPADKAWVSAEPRAATSSQVREACDQALARIAEDRARKESGS